jgi:hypothetical protein
LCPAGRQVAGRFSKWFPGFEDGKRGCNRQRWDIVRGSGDESGRGVRAEIERAEQHRTDDHRADEYYRNDQQQFCDNPRVAEDAPSSAETEGKATALRAKAQGNAEHPGEHRQLFDHLDPYAGIIGHRRTYRQARNPAESPSSPTEIITCAVSSTLRPRRER